MLVGEIPSLDVVKNLYKKSVTMKCIRCKQEDETVDHLFHCQHTETNMKTIRKAIQKDFIEIIETKDKKDQNKAHQKQKPTPNAQWIQAIQDTHFGDNHFLETQQAKGIITQNLIDEINNTNSQYGISQGKRLNNTITLTHLWLRQFVEVIWKSRNILLMKAAKKRKETIQRRKRMKQLTKTPTTKEGTPEPTDTPRRHTHDSHDTPLLPNIQKRKPTNTHYTPTKQRTSRTNTPILTKDGKRQKQCTTHKEQIIETKIKTPTKKRQRHPTTSPQKSATLLIKKIKQQPNLKRPKKPPDKVEVEESP